MDNRHKKIKMLLDKVGRFNNGIDIGCGPGGDFELLKRYGKIIGLNYNPVNHPDIVTGDIRKTKFKDGEFDFVFTSLTLPHIIELDKAMSEISRITRKGGKIIVIVFADCIAHRLFRTGLKKEIRPYQQYDILRLFSKEEIVGLLENSGFRTIEMGLFRYNLSHIFGQRYYYIGEKK